MLEGAQFKYFRINQELADINGLSVEEHLGKPLAEVLPQAAKDIVPVLQKYWTQVNRRHAVNFVLGCRKIPLRFLTHNWQMSNSKCTVQSGWLLSMAFDGILYN